MDIQRIVEALQASLQAENRENAEKLLDEMHKIIGFGPSLLQIVLEESLDLAVRQAGAVYFKNLVGRSWKQREPLSPEDPIPFTIHENDKESIRNHIVAAIMTSIIPIQSILGVAIGRILKSDFPSRFPTFLDQLMPGLGSTDFRTFHGALVCLYQLVMVYELRRHDRGPLPTVRSNIFPILHQRLTALMPDTSNESLTLQKSILKVFHRCTNFALPPNAMNEEWITQWHMLICSLVVNFNGANDDGDSVYWKRQKWAVRILTCWFTSYGSPNNVQKKYQQFAEWYLKGFSHQVITSFLTIFDAYRQHTYVAPIVMNEAFGYLSAAISHSFCWKIILPHFDTILQEVVVPLLSFTDELAELWESDPLEYIRDHSSSWSINDSPECSSAAFMKEVCSKRRGVLDKSMQYCIQVLNHDVKPEIKDGVLRLIGHVSHHLLKTPIYKEQLENFLTSHVLPLFEAPKGYQRARACWLVGRLSRAQFTNVQLLCQTAMACRHYMCNDPELPVRVAATIAIFSLIKDQNGVKNAMRPHIHEIVMQLLKLLRETEFDDLNAVFRDILVYSEEIIPISVQMLQHLSGTFAKFVGLQVNEAGVVCTGDNGETKSSVEEDYQSMVATGVIENIENLVAMMEDNEALMANAEPVIVELVHAIFKNNISEFYEEALSLISYLTANRISPQLWTVFEWISEAFMTTASDCFHAMTPALHNYATVDPAKFLEKPERVRMYLAVCTEALKSDDNLDSENGRAAKLMEVLPLNYRGQMNAILPEIIEAAISRINQKGTSTELRMRCLVVIIASMFTAMDAVLPILCNHNWPETQTTIIEHVLKMLLSGVNKLKGLHDRRVCVLGLCALLSLSQEQRPPSLVACAPQILPTLLTLLNTLKEAYAAKKEAENEEESESDGDLDDESDVLSEPVNDDDDIVDEQGNRYLELLDVFESELTDTDEDDEEEEEDDDDDGDDDFDTDSVIESYETALDEEENDMEEYVTFYQVMTRMENADAEWYQNLVAPLTDQQKNEFKEIAKIALNTIAQRESKRIEKAGGYSFKQTDVPSSFNFSGDPPPQA